MNELCLYLLGLCTGMIIAFVACATMLDEIQAERRREAPIRAIREAGGTWSD